MNSRKNSAARRPSQRLRETRLRRLDRRSTSNAVESKHKDLIAALNHNLRTPLNGIVGMLNLLQQSRLSTEQSVLVQGAAASAEELFRLMRTLLDYSQIDKTTDSGPAQAYDLFQQIEQTIRSQMLAGFDHCISISSAFSGLAHAAVFGDPDLIRKIIGNLIEIVLATQQHQQLQIDIDLRAGTAQTVRLAVRVYGSGTHHHLKPNPAKIRDLRLNLMRRLLESLGGQTGIEEAHGTTEIYWLKLDLPLAPNPLGGARLLFVEADPDLRSDRLAQLRAGGLRAEAFDTMGAALIALTRALQADDPYQLMILDQNMQTANGEACGKILASDPAFSALRLLLVCPPPAHDERAQFTPARVANAGFSAWLQQPFSTQTLLSTLAQMRAGPDTRSLRPFITNVRAVVHDDETRPFTGYRVLAVDDHEINLQVVGHILARLGCKVELATDGAQAVARQQTQNFDLIFMDILMPELDGYQACARIRFNEGPARHTPIIAITACTLPGEQQACYNAGMDDVITKPISAEQIFNALTRWLKPTSNDALEAVRDQLGNDFIELAVCFRKDSPALLNALQNALAAGDTAAISRNAQAVSSNACLIGAHNLSTLFCELDAHCRSGARDGVNERLQAIKNEYARIETQLRNIVSAMRG